MSATLAHRLVRDVRQAGAKLIYALDDNLLDLPPGRFPFLEGLHGVVRFLLRESDGVLVTTEKLKEQFLPLNSNVTVLPHALDERLLVQTTIPRSGSPFGPRKKIIGYMGTLTHDDDLKMILPALQAVCKRHDAVELQIIGAIGQDATLKALDKLPMRIVGPNPEEAAYPLFMLWFTSRIRWDIGISPLRDNFFNQCKSDIKFLDYSAIGAAGIYGLGPAYEASVKHAQTGLLVENSISAWEEALETLLTDDELRMRIAGNAARNLYDRRILAHSAHRWLSTLEELLAGA